MLGTLVLQAIIQIIKNLAETAGGDFARHQIQGYMAQQALGGKIAGATQQAYARFHQESDDHELLTALDTAGFGDDAAVAELLAHIATDQHHRQAQVHELAALMHRDAPHVAPHRCHQAAERLATLIHSAVGLLPELHQAVLILRGEQLLDEMHRQRRVPEYAPGVREGITGAAIATAEGMGHGYVTAAHLFYALLLQPRPLVPQILRRASVTPERVRDLLSGIRPYDGLVDDPLTENAVRILARAQEIARDAPAPATRDDHVLLALLEYAAESQGMAYLLASLGINADQLRAIVRRQGQVVTAMQRLAGGQ